MSETRILKKIVENPVFNIIVGLVLLLSGLSDALDQWNALGHIKLSVHHGVSIFAIVHILKSVIDIQEGIDRMKAQQ